MTARQSGFAEMKSRRKSHRGLSWRSGFTLIELLAVMLIVGGAVLGMGIGAAIARKHGLAGAGGGIVGAILGGAAVVAFYYLLALRSRLRLARHYKTLAPDQDCLARGAKFICSIDRRTGGHSGAAYDEHGDIRWRYGVRKNDLGRSWGNPFNKKDFVVADPQTGEEIVLRRASFFPPRFTIMDAQGVRGTVRMVSILRNEYAIHVTGRQPWTFRMPLFNYTFWGGTDESPEFWVIERTKMDWHFLIKPGIEDQPLVAALSFIHVERWNYS
jgi:prepilin-type N-terminal cleavage/methylation domain-containing protein